MVADPHSLLDAALADPDRRRVLLLRYLRDQLDAALLESLEIRIMADPALLAEVESEELLLEGMKAWAAGRLGSAAARDPESAAAAAPGLAALPSPSAGPAPARPWLRARHDWRALAAALLLALLPAAWWLGAQRSSPGFEAVDFHTLAAQRGTGQEPPPSPVLELSPGAARIVLRLPAPNRPGVQALELWREGESHPRARLQLQPDGDGWVAAAFERALLPGGRYELRWPDAGAEAASFFEIEKK